MSYHTPDREAVLAVQRTLELQGITTFFDQIDLRPGLPWGEKLEQALRSVRAVALFIGREEGRFQGREKWFALARQDEEKSRGRTFPVIPVLLPGAENPAVSFLFMHTWVDLRNDLSAPAEIDRLVKALRGEPPSPPGSKWNEVCPYRGLKAFGEADEPLFFGRTDLSKQLLEMVVSGRDFVAVIGASGSGKSSLVHAGLLPLLRRQRPPSKTWDAISFRPGNRPFHSLAGALVPLIDPGLAKIDRGIKASELANLWARDTSLLAGFVEQILIDSGGTDQLLIVIDQFEELFTLSSEAERRSFLQLILAAPGTAPVQFVLTVRADYYGHLVSTSRVLSDRVQRNTLNVAPMTRQELEESIVKPAEKVGLGFEAGLVDRILNDFGDEPGQLPLLEFALTELWDRCHQGRLMTHVAYIDSGGVAEAISRRAEAVFEKFDTEKQARIRQIFSRLVHVAVPGAPGSDVRLRPTLDELGASARPFVDALTKERLLVTTADKDTKIVHVEVAHEALIRGWPRLRDWLKEDGVFLLWRQRLRLSLTQWQFTGQDRGALLRGALLKEALGSRSSRADDLSVDEREFIDLSFEAYRRRRRHVLLIAAVGLALASIAFWESRRLNHEHRIELAQALLARARTYKENDPSKLDLAVLFGIESLKLNQTVEADSIIRESLLLLPKSVTAVPTACDLAPRVFALSPDANHLACVDKNGAAIVVSTQSGTSVIEPITEFSNVSAMALSPGAQFLLLGLARDRGFKLIDTEKLTKTKSAEVVMSGGNGSEVSAATFDTNQKRFAVALWNERGSSIDLVPTNGASASRLAAVPGSRRVYALACSGDGQSLAALLEGQTSEHMDVTIFAVPPNGRPPMPAGGATMGTIALAQDGQSVAVCRENSVIFGGAASAAASRQLAHKKRAGAAALSASRKYMASGSDDGTAQVMDIRNGRQIAIVPVGSPVEAAGFTTTDALVLLSVDGTIRTVDLANKAGFEQVRSGSGRIVDISPAGKYFATWLPAPGNSHELVINDRSGRRLWSLPVRSDTFAATASFGFSIDDKYFTVVDPQAGVTMYEAFGGAMVSKEEGTAQSAVAVISGDGRTVVWAVGNTLKILRLSLESGHVAAVRDLPPIGRGIGRIAVLALSPDGTLLAAAGEGGSGGRTGISVFDVNANKWLASTDDEVHVELAAFSDDGRHLLTLSENRLMLFKMPGGVRAWPANTALGIKDVAHIGFSHDGHMIAAVGEDVSNSTMAMELIDAADGKALASTRYPANDKMDGIRHALAFEPDFLAIADGISIARLPRTRDALVTLACSVSRAGIPPDEWKNVDMPVPATCRGQSRK